MRTSQSAALRGYRSDGRIRKHAPLILLAAMAFLQVPCAVHAQVLYGTLTGNVTDPSGAAVPGAKAEAVNTGTGIARQADTDAAGAYLFTNLQSGAYKVTVTSKGFQTTVVDGVSVNTNEVRRVDLALRIAAAAEVIEVSVPAAGWGTHRYFFRFRANGAGP